MSLGAPCSPRFDPRTIHSQSPAPVPLQGTGRELTQGRRAGEAHAWTLPLNDSVWIPSGHSGLWTDRRDYRRVPGTASSG